MFGQIHHGQGGTDLDPDRLVPETVRAEGKGDVVRHRWLGHFPAAEGLLEVRVERDKAGRACALKITERGDRSAWAAHGSPTRRPPYSLPPPRPTARICCAPNCPEQDPAKLWRWYIQLTQAEDAFRISKSDLSLRPVFHQKCERVEAHILVCFLDATDATREVRLRVVARPDRPVAELLHRLGLDLPSAPKVVQKNVVEKNGF